MTPKEIAEKSKELWCDYYRDGEYTSDEIIEIITKEIEKIL